MAKAKVDKIEMRSIDGIDFKEVLKIDIFFEGRFFIYIPDFLLASVRPEDRSVRHEGTVGVKKHGKANPDIMIGTSPEDIKRKLYYYLEDYYKNNHKEEKIIHYNFRYNSTKLYRNHDKNVPFADTPAMSLHWGIHYLITFADGRQTVLSDPYEKFGNLCSPTKFDKPLNKYSEKYQWIMWTEEREEFFVNTTLAMENLIAKVSNFFGQDPVLLASAVDNMPKLIG